MLSELDISSHSDTSSSSDNVEADLWQRNHSDVEPEIEQPLPELPLTLFRTGSQEREQEETKHILQFVQGHIETCRNSECLSAALTPEEIQDCNYVRLMRTIKNSRRFVKNSFNNGNEKLGNTSADYLRSLLRG
jgi:hypothetical protein